MRRAPRVVVRSRMLFPVDAQPYCLWQIKHYLIPSGLTESALEPRLRRTLILGVALQKRSIGATQLAGQWASICIWRAQRKRAQRPPRRARLLVHQAMRSVASGRTLN